MFMFFGDSHSRQFQMDVSGAFSFTSFSGATLKGLGTPGGKLNHHRIALDFTRVKTRKTIFVMFGGVDLDASYFRKIVEDGEVDENLFFNDRSEALQRFIEQCRTVGGKYVSRLCVLLPHSSALVDEHFVGSTAKMAKIDPEALERAGARHDFSLLTRCRRARAFNDHLVNSLAIDGLAELYRIDEKMVDAAGLIRPEFLPKDLRDHHPRKEFTLPLWQETLRDVVPVYGKLHQRRLDRL